LPPAPPAVEQAIPAPPVEKPRTPKQLSDKRVAGPRTDKKREEGGRGGEAGRGDSWRGGGGRGRGDRPYTGRGRESGRGRGDYRKKEQSEAVAAPAPQATEPKVTPSLSPGRSNFPQAKTDEADNEQLALARFQNAQEKMLKKEQQQRAQVLSLSLSLTHHPNAAPQETKKGQKQVVNAFDALQSDDSDEEA
jgi:hypothetical protein